MPNAKAQMPNECQMSKPKAQKNGYFLALGFWILFDTCPVESPSGVRYAEFHRVKILKFGIARSN
jgi:hypothetical protein